MDKKALLSTILKKEECQGILFTNLYDILFLLDEESSLNFVEANPYFLYTEEKGFLIGDEISLSLFPRKRDVVKIKVETEDYIKMGFAPAAKIAELVKKENMHLLCSFHPVEIPGVKVKVVENPLLRLQQIYTDERLERLVEAIRICERVLEEIKKEIQEGMWEIDLRAGIERKIFEKGGDGRPFPARVAFGENTAIPQHIPGSRELKKGDLILVDFGVFKKGVCGEITRMFCLGEPAEEWKKIEEILREAREKALLFMKPGKVASEVDRIVREFFNEKGYRENFLGVLGEPVTPGKGGIYLRPGESSILKPGLAFTLEPSLYFPRKGGMRIEDVVVITESSNQVLTTFPLFTCL
ncbi:hypothetical protein DRQ20_06645 [bacterium]|nr:MAG: hypothetical protein DRQ20_06645 [bacterium]